jgi:hypothetical protein
MIGLVERREAWANTLLNESVQRADSAQFDLDALPCTTELE